jgi:hypothetical protein
LTGALAWHELTVRQAPSDPNRARTREELLVFASAIVPLKELKIVKHRTSSYTISARFLYGSDFNNAND